MVVRPMKTTLALAAALLLVAAIAGPASAATHDVVFPAGVACPSFELGADISGGHQKTHEFYDRDGNPVRTMFTGVGQAVTFFNDAKGTSLYAPPRGANQTVASGPDGTTILTFRGDTGITLFPTDLTAGPSTILYEGRVVVSVDADGRWLMVSTSGKSIDVCAALS